MMSAHSAAELGTSYDCKQPGCTNAARSRVGRYSYCDEHRNQRASLAGRVEKAETFAGKVTELSRAAKLADKARATARKLTAQALEAKTEADAREAEFRQVARELIGETAIESAENGNA
jgi:uncharacterized coiled-coil DUF342 family protein